MTTLALVAVIVGGWVAFDLLVAVGLIVGSWWLQRHPLVRVPLERIPTVPHGAPRLRPLTFCPDETPPAALHTLGRPTARRSRDAHES